MGHSRLVVFRHADEINKGPLHLLGPFPLPPRAFSSPALFPCLLSIPGRQLGALHAVNRVSLGADGRPTMGTMEGGRDMTTGETMTDGAGRWASQLLDPSVRFPWNVNSSGGWVWGTLLPVQ